MMKKYIFWFWVVLLIIVLITVSFYVFCVHVPYYNHEKSVNEARNEICETHHYEYMDYCYEYRGNQLYYILKVKINGIESYVAYDENLELVATYQGDVADEANVKEAIEQKYQFKPDRLEVGYENQKFVYYAKYQDEESLLYVYYRLSDGEFLKAVKFEE